MVYVVVFNDKIYQLNIGDKNIYFDPEYLLSSSILPMPVKTYKNIEEAIVENPGILDLI